MLAVSLPPTQARFHWYQLLTSAFLHGGILHLAGNLLFMLVFGWRVNELVGNGKMLILYPLLAAASAGTYHIMASDQPMVPYLGASGAIMGLAGMYLVLFPAQKVHMIAWFRLLLLRAWKIFRVSGFWMLLLWVAFNDVLPTALKRSDHVAHWAHLGGFVAGAFIAIVLLVTRLVTARGRISSRGSLGNARGDCWGGRARWRWDSCTEPKGSCVWRRTERRRWSR